jgi:ABC-type transport system involved in cytochrome c biogenesis permease component
MFARIVWLVLRKDFIVEVRSLEIAYTTLFFAISCVLVFAFALVQEGRAPEGGAAGILWIAIAFAGTLALGRTFDRERQNETLRALLLAPAPRAAIYVGKLAGVLALLLLVEALVVLSAWGPQPVAWMWVGSQLDHATGSVFLGIVAAFAGLIGSLILTLMLATRLDHLWRLLRRAAGHDQREGVLGRIFAITAVVAAVGFTVWLLLLEGPGSSIAPR